MFVRCLPFAPSQLNYSFNETFYLVPVWLVFHNSLGFLSKISVYFLNFKNLLETETLLGMLLLPFQTTQVHWKVSNCLMTGMLGWQFWNWFSSLTWSLHSSTVYHPAYMASIFGSQFFPFLGLASLCPPTRSPWDLSLALVKASSSSFWFLCQ